MEKLSQFFSKKLCLTLLVLALGVLAPLVYKNNSVTDTITLTVLALIAAVGTSYGIVQGKIDLEKEKQ